MWNGNRIRRATDKLYYNNITIGYVLHMNRPAYITCAKYRRLSYVTCITYSSYMSYSKRTYIYIAYQISDLVDAQIVHVYKYVAACRQCI